MRYILTPDKDGTQFGAYLKALASFREQLPPEVAEFAGAEERYRLDHPSSLHDAWIQEIVVRESRSTDDAPSKVQIVLTLLGQMHDRTITLAYADVADYVLRAGRGPMGSCDTFHGDIFTHEVRVSDGGEVIHEIAVGDEGTIMITCKTFTVSERLK